MLNIKQIITILKNEWAVLSVAFLVLCLSFSPLWLNFIWGNHDWQLLIHDMQLSSGLIEGRFSQYGLVNLLLMGKILPILNVVLGFFFYILALFLICKYYFGYSIDNKFLISLFIAAAASSPYIVELLYFHFITFSLLSWPLFVGLALIAVKMAEVKHSLLYFFTAFLILFVVLGGYPAAINMFVVLAVCYMIKQHDESYIGFLQILRKSLPYIMVLLLAMLALKLTFIFLQHKNLMLDLYNNQSATVSELFQKLYDIIKASCWGFIQSQPFLKGDFKIPLTILFVTFVLVFLKTANSLSAFFIRLMLLFCLILSLKFSAWLSSDNADSALTSLDPAKFMVRTDFYSYPYIILFSLFYLYRQNKQFLKNMSFILSILLILGNINAGLSFSKVHWLGFVSENKLLERVIARIQENPNFINYQAYTIVQAGEFPLRERYYQSSDNEKYGYYTLKAPYFRHWIAFEYYNFFAPYDFVKEGTFINTQAINPDMVNFIASDMKVWPSPFAVYVDDNYAIVVLSEVGRDNLKGQFNALNLSYTSRKFK